MCFPGINARMEGLIIRNLFSDNSAFTKAIVVKTIFAAQQCYFSEGCFNRFGVILVHFGGKTVDVMFGNIVNAEQWGRNGVCTGDVAIIYWTDVWKWQSLVIWGVGN